MDSHDVRMIDSPGGAGLLVEAAQPICIRREGGRQDLEPEADLSSHR
jgi:hypothetical protein